MGTGLLDGADGRLLGENICPCVEGVFSANPGPWPGQSLLDTLSVRVKGTALRTVLATCPSPRFTCLLRSFLAMWVKDFSSVFKAHFESWSRCAAPLSGAKGTAPAVTAEEDGAEEASQRHGEPRKPRVHARLAHSLTHSAFCFFCSAFASNLKRRRRQSVSEGEDWCRFSHLDSAERGSTSFIPGQDTG